MEDIYNLEVFFILSLFYWPGRHVWPMKGKFNTYLQVHGKKESLTQMVFSIQACFICGKLTLN